MKDPYIRPDPSGARGLGCQSSPAGRLAGPAQASALDSPDVLISPSAAGLPPGLGVQSRKVKGDARVDGDYRLTESGVDGGLGDVSQTRANGCTVASAV
jgi:hypothetical protein